MEVQACQVSRTVCPGPRSRSTSNFSFIENCLDSGFFASSPQQSHSRHLSLPPQSNIAVLNSPKCCDASTLLARLVSVLALSFLFVGSVITRDKQTMPEINPSYHAEAKSLAGRILKRADEAQCHRNSCTILVANFHHAFRVHVASRNSAG